MHNILKSNQAGHSLMEVILASGVLAIVSLVFTVVVIDTQETNIITGNYFRANLIAQEGMEVVRNLRDESFNNLQDGTHGLVLNNGQWEFNGEEDSQGIFSRQIIISTNENSTSTKDVVTKVSWQTNLQREGLIIFKTSLTNWQGD